MSQTRNTLVLTVFSLCLVANVAWSQEMPKPGPEHKLLQQLEGTWDAVVKMPDGGEQSKAVATYKMECGGMWLFSDFSGSMGDMKFQGRGIDGYDSDKKKFVSVWVDSMSNSPMNLEGTHDEKTKTMTMVGDGKGPDGKPTKFKMVTVMPDKDHQTFKMNVIGPDGKDILIMSIEYTRRK